MLPWLNCWHSCRTPTLPFATMTQKELETPTVKVPTILEEIRNSVSKSTEVTFVKGCDINSPDESGFGEAVKAARDAEVVILVMGGRSGLTLENTTGEFRDATDLGLPGSAGEIDLRNTGSREAYRPGTQQRTPGIHP